MIKNNCIKNKSVKELDAILKLFNSKKKSLSYYKIKQEAIYSEFEKKGINTFLILLKLEKDGFLSSNPLYSEGKELNEKSYHINYDGQVFIEHGGYVKQNLVFRLNRIWIVVKLIANLMNALCIICIAYKGYEISRETKTKDEKIDNLEKDIKTYQKEVDSLKIMVFDNRKILPKNSQTLK